MHHSAALQHWLVVLLAASALLCASGEAAGDAASAGATAAAPSQCRTSSTPVRVLALGDSLTNGAVPSQSRNYPYTQKLSQLMSAELGRPIDVKIVASNGAGTVMPSIDASDRGVTLPLLLDRALAGGQRYDVAVLMGGINDLGRGNKSAALVLDQLRALVDRTARATGYAIVLVAPWANRFVSRGSDNEAQRQKLLAALRAQFDASKGAGPPALLLDQIEANEFRFWDLPDAERLRLQDDLLHLTPAGYDELGAHIFGTLLNSGALADIKCGVPPRKPQLAGGAAQGRALVSPSMPAAGETAQAAAPAAPAVPGAVTSAAGPNGLQRRSALGTFGLCVAAALLLCLY